MVRDISKKSDAEFCEKSNNIFEENNNDSDSDFIISEYGDGWSYKTYVNGEKIFLIANELDDLKNKVRSQNLPLEYGI